MFAAGQSIAQDTIRVRLTEWPPNYYQDASGDWTGLDVEIMKAIMKTAGLKFQFVNEPWVRGLKNLEHGETHMMMNMSKTDERSAYINWIGPVRATSGMGLIVKKENVSLPIKTLDDLVAVAKDKGKKYGFLRGAFYSQEFNDRINNDKEFQQYFEPISRSELNIRKTIGNRILGFFESLLGMKYRIINNSKYNELVVHPFRFKSDSSGIFIGVSKKGVDPETLKRIQKSFEKNKENGTIKLIIEKWNRRFN